MDVVEVRLDVVVLEGASPPESEMNVALGDWSTRAKPKDGSSYIGELLCWQER